MATVYTLTLKGARKDAQTQKPIDLDITTNSLDNDYQIKRISYEKRLYSPCVFNIELSLINDKRTLSGIQSDFANKREVSLSVANNTDTAITISKIATNYFVYQYNPVYADSKCSIFLTLYSRDKLLTLDKFNKAYLNKKLGKGIIKEMLDNSTGLLKDCKVTFDLNNGDFDAQRLQVLSYSVTDTKTTWYEVTQPYRVQYNEDFYSFISRIACRCGEFLYFEDGKLKLGLDTGDNVIEIASSDIISKEYPSCSSSDLTVKSCFRDYFLKDTTSSKNDLTCSDYGAFDEYFDVLDLTKLPDCFNDELYWPDFAELVKDSALPMVGKFGAKEAYTSVTKVLGLGVELATLLVSWKKAADYVNDKFKEDFSNIGTTDKLSQFADVEQDRYGKLLNKQLAEIRDKEMKAVRETVLVRVKTEFATNKNIKLGSKVKLDGKEYRVISCTGQYFKTAVLVGFNKYTGEPKYEEEITDITAFELVPTQSITIAGEKSAVDRFIPPYNKCAESVPASPQIAIVTADNDPRYIGRVRVRYTWQKSDEPGSPWVRVLAPLASSSGAVHFQPKEDDEVMLGYIDGNIDRPYVAGSLFNDKDKIHDCLFSAYNDTIRVGSQRLDFRKGTIQNWLDSVIPFAGMVNSFLPGNMADMVKSLDNTSDFAKGLHGVTRLTDTNSIWTIEGNTAARSVTIKSAWGRVKINGYAGISIESAGDISIKGKNISISAQNNIKIESGIAIKNARKSAKIYKEKDALGILGTAALTTLEDLAFGSIDLSLPRTIWESIVPPKEGTLKIKSNRYLALEAGRGEAYDNENIGKEAGLKRFAVTDTKGDIFPLLVHDINAIHDAVASYHKKRAATYNLYSEISKYKRDLELFKKINEEKYKNLLSIDEIINNAKSNKYSIENYEDYKTISKLLNEEEDSNAILITNTEIKYARRWMSHIKSILDKKRLCDETDTQVITLTGTLTAYGEDIKKEYPEDENRGLPSMETVFQKVIKKYLESNNNLTCSTAVVWETFVKELKLKGGKSKSKGRQFFEYLFNEMGIASDAEYERIYNDSKAKNIAEGRILMSQDKGKSLHINGTTIEETPNDTLESVKEALRRPFPLIQIDEEIEELI